MSIVDKLTPHPPAVETKGKKAPPPPPKAPLTEEEKTLLGRSQSFITDLLKSHGITLAPQEKVWIGAGVADFITDELKAAEEAAKAKDSGAQAAGFTPAA